MLRKVVKCEHRKYAYAMEEIIFSRQKRNDFNQAVDTQKTIIWRVSAEYKTAKIYRQKEQFNFEHAFSN